MKYQLWLYDVWGNSKDGYDVNNWHPANISIDGSIFNTETVTIDISNDATDYQINRKLGVRGINWEDSLCHSVNSYELTGHYKRNGKPFGFLRLIEEIKNAI